MTCAACACVCVCVALHQRYLSWETRQSRERLPIRRFAKKNTSTTKKTDWQRTETAVASCQLLFVSLQVCRSHGCFITATKEVMVSPTSAGLSVSQTGKTPDGFVTQTHFNVDAHLDQRPLVSSLSVMQGVLNIVYLNLT